MASIRAVYRDGQLRPLEPLNLREGDEVEIQIVTPPRRLTDAVADILVRYDDDGEETDEDALQAVKDWQLITRITTRSIG
jgi:predicted DNA-binding antitoxin AbrB/MazE fold protein